MDWLWSTDAVNLRVESVPPPESIESIEVMDPKLVEKAQAMVLSLLEVVQVNSTSCPALTFCDCGVSTTVALVQVISVEANKIHVAKHSYIFGRHSGFTSEKK